MLLLKYISTIWFASSASALFNSFTGRQKIIQPSESTMGHYPCWLFSCSTMEGFIQKQVILRLPDEIVFHWASRSDVKPSLLYLSVHNNNQMSIQGFLKLLYWPQLRCQAKTESEVWDWISRCIWICAFFRRKICLGPQHHIHKRLIKKNLISFSIPKQFSAILVLFNISWYILDRTHRTCHT